MKPIIPFALLGALLAVGAANAASTDPVGYVTLGDTTVGQPSVKANTDVAASLPLDRAAVFVGTAASVAGNVITLSGTPALGTLTGPHLVKIESGTAGGLNALITANTANTVTVTLQPGDSLTGVAAGTALSIRPAWTLKTIFAGNTLPSGTQVLAFGGSTPGINLAPDSVYEWDGSGWTDLSTFDGADDVVLFSGESFVLRNPTATAIASLVITGDVSTSDSRVVISKLGASVGQDNRSAYVGPVNEVIGSSSLGAALNNGDQLLVFNNNAPGINKAPSTVLEWDGSAWTDLETFDDVTTTFTLTGGQGYVIRRAASAAVGDKIWTDTPAYITNL